MNNVLLIVNTGTPDAPDRKSVRRYLSEFLNDPMVIDMPLIPRHILVNLFIIPFRSSYSSRLYKQIWSEIGSPLLVNHMKLARKLQAGLKDWDVIGVMRYGNPSLQKALEQLHGSTVNKITVLPLYPQYALSTTGTVETLVTKYIPGWQKKPEIRFIREFYSNDGFIRAYSKKIKECQPGNFDHLLFSYHSLPVRHIQKIHPAQHYESCDCTVSFPEQGAKCYRAQCYETSRLIANALGLKKSSWSVSFQSRLTRKWIGPFTDSVLKQLASEGKESVLVVAPSFTADCLETLLEIGQSYRQLFIKAGGKQLQLCECLNDDDEWVKAIIEILTRSPAS